MREAKVAAPARAPGRPGLLFNMSVAPRTTIQHTGRPYGPSMVFALPAQPASLAAADVLSLLDRGVRSVGDLPEIGRRLRQFSHTLSPEDADAELRRRLNAHGQTLRLPAAAPVSDQAPGDAPECAEFLTVLTVLAKSSPHVFLRDKEPNLLAIRPGRRITLVLPPNWRPSCP